VPAEPSRPFDHPFAAIVVDSSDSLDSPTWDVQDGAGPNRWQRFLLSGRAERLAARVISEHAADGLRLTAASIGGAACAFVRTPAEWTEWGAPDASLTVLKDLWRILAAHGRPDTDDV
jgi:Protein of unknown function (DUF3626)